MDDELKKYLDQRFDQVIEQMRDMQSELLRAFIPAQRQIETRQTVVETRIGGVEERQHIIEQRLMEIEKKLLLNPPAA